MRWSDLLRTVAHLQQAETALDETGDRPSLPCGRSPPKALCCSGQHPFWETRFEPWHGYVTEKHSRENTVTRDSNGDVTNMSGTITEASGTRPYGPRPATAPKHAKR